jgi:hypothetical protein
MIAGRDLGGTLTVTETNNTDSYVIYEFIPSDVSYSSGVLSIQPTNAYASPLVENLDLSVGNVCITFDLFKSEKVITGTTSPNGGVAVAIQGEPDHLNVRSEIIIDTNSQVEINGYLINETLTVNSLTGTGTIELTSFDDTIGSGAIIDYVLRRTDSLSTRTGQLMVAWDTTVGGTTRSVSSDVSTNDTNASTDDVALSSSVTGNKIYVNAIKTGATTTYSIKLFIRHLPTFR